MKALTCTALAPDFAGVALQDVDIPTIGANEVLVKNRAACVNFPDLLMTEGKYQHRPDLPFVIGMESAGDVVEVGSEVHSVKVGDRVIVGGKSGAFADYRAASAQAVRGIPAGLDYAEGAAHTAGMLTAYVSLVRLGQIAAGETILVHGAAGGVGHAAVQLAKHIGATVIATSASAQKREWLRGNADHVLEPGEALRDDVMAINPKGVDLCFDPIGGDVFDRSVRCMGFGGRYLVIGFTSGRIPEISVNYPLIKGFSIIGVRAGEYGRRFPTEGAENIAAIDALAYWCQVRFGRCGRRASPSEKPQSDWACGDSDVKTDRRRDGWTDTRHSVFPFLHIEGSCRSNSDASEHQLHSLQQSLFFSQLHKKQYIAICNSTAAAQSLPKFDGSGNSPPLPRPPVITNGLHAQRGGRLRLCYSCFVESEYCVPTEAPFLCASLSTIKPSPCG
jgi:NADPH:quinone reductase